MQRFWAFLATVAVIGLLAIGWLMSENGRYSFQPLQSGGAGTAGYLIDTRTGTTWFIVRDEVRGKILISQN